MHSTRVTIRDTVLSVDTGVKEYLGSFQQLKVKKVTKNDNKIPTPYTEDSRNVHSHLWPSNEGWVIKSQ